MNLVLETERRAREEIERCEREATEVLDEAQRRARRVVERCDARITAIRRRSAQATERAVSALLAGDTEVPEGSGDPEREAARIEAAAGRLAARLTSIHDDSSEHAPRP